MHFNCALPFFVDKSRRGASCPWAGFCGSTRSRRWGRTAAAAGQPVLLFEYPGPFHPVLSQLTETKKYIHAKASPAVPKMAQDEHDGARMMARLLQVCQSTTMRWQIVSPDCPGAPCQWWWRMARMFLNKQKKRKFWTSRVFGRKQLPAVGLQPPNRGRKRSRKPCGCPPGAS